MATTIDGVKTLQIRNAKNGDFDLNLSGGSGGESKPFYPIITFDDQMQVTDIQQGVVSAQSGTVIGRMSGQEMAFSVIALMNIVQSQPVYRYFVSVMDLGVFELILNASNEITEVQFINGRISVCTDNQLTINSKELIKLAYGFYGALVELDPNTEEETRTEFTSAEGGKKAVGVSQIVPLNYGIEDILLYNPTENVITFNADSELYSIESV